MITFGPWQEYAPGSDVEDFQRGFSQTAGVVDQNFARHQRQQEIGLEKERLAKEEQGMAVSQELEKQRNQMAVAATARRYQAQQGYQSDIAHGMPAAQAFVKWAPLMGASLAGLGSDIAQISKSGAAAPPAMAPSTIPGTAPRPVTAATAPEASATPIYDENGNVVAHSYGKSTHWITPPHTASAGKMSDVDRQDIADIDKELNSIQTQVMQGKLVGTSLNKARIRVEQLNKQKAAVQAKYRTPAVAPPPPAGPSDKVTYQAPPHVAASAPFKAPAPPLTPGTNLVNGMLSAPVGPAAATTPQNNSQDDPLGLR